MGLGSVSRAALLASVILTGSTFAAFVSLAAEEGDRVELIMEKLPAEGSAEYKALKRAAGKATGQKLPMTAAEMWSVPKDKAEGLLRLCKKHGVYATQLGADWNHLFKPMAKSETTMDAKQQAMMDMAMADRANTGMGMMATAKSSRVEYAMTKGMDGKHGEATPMTLKVALNEKTTVTLTRRSVELTKEGCIWRGVVEGSEHPVTLMWWPGGRLTGTIHHEGRTYQIRHMGGDMHGVVETNPDMLPPEHGSMPRRRMKDPNVKDDPLVTQGDASMLRSMVDGMRPRPPRPTRGETQNQEDAAVGKGKPGGRTAAKTNAKSTAANSKGGKAQPVVIDIAVAYTKAAARHYSDITRDLVHLSVQEANATFRNSGVGNVQLRLVHTYETDYVEGDAEHFDHLWRMADKGDGFMEEVHRIRDEKRGDVVILVVDDPKGCGLATRVGADPDEAFAVVHHACSAATYSLAHEVGHIIGARHDIGLDPSMEPFPYGHGYVNGTKWRTMMSYKASCNNCPRMPVWSSPRVMVKGELAGTPMHDNARVILEQAARVAAFR